MVSPPMEEPGQLKRAMIDSTAGAIAGCVSRTVTSPLDVIKIRFQVQLEPTTSWALAQRSLSGPSKYTGMVQATKDIFREEGLPVGCFCLFRDHVICTLQLTCYVGNI
ncbi:hypothetical protein IC582_026969 [Cucumis melo]